MRRNWSNPDFLRELKAPVMKFDGVFLREKYEPLFTGIVDLLLVDERSPKICIVFAAD
jgi:hypothetical protein